MADLYEFIIKDKAGNALASLTGARQRFFANYLNKPGEARFTISASDPLITEGMLLLGYNELYIYRAGTLMWGGELAYSRFDLSDDMEQIQVTAKGFLDLFSKRIVGTAANPRIFTDDDLVYIAQTIVTESQALTNGDFGITIGATPTSRNGDRTYNYKPAKEALEELSNSNIQDGIDLEVTADKKLNCFYPAKGQQLPSVVFEYGVNITSFFQTLDATQMVNQVIALGAGEGSSMLTSVRNASTYLQETYKLRQGLISYKDVEKQDTLDEHGDKELAQKSAQQQIIGLKTKGNLQPVLGSYSVGDSPRVKVNYGLVNVDDFYRLYGQEVAISDEDDEDITLLFSTT